MNNFKTSAVLFGFILTHKRSLWLKNFFFNICRNQKFTYFNITICILFSFFYTIGIETNIMENGMVTEEGVEKLSTKTELSIKENGIGVRVMMVNMNTGNMDKELYTMQTDMYSTKVCGTKTSMKAIRNTKLLKILHKLGFR